MAGRRHGESLPEFGVNLLVVALEAASYILNEVEVIFDAEVQKTAKNDAPQISLAKVSESADRRR
jgi:hypothetical protein